MKRFIAFFLAMLFTLSFSTTAFAYDTSLANSYQISNTEYFSDGSYIITTLTESQMRSSKSGTKRQDFYSSSDVLQWRVVLNGTFTYNGTTSSCTSSSYSVTIYNNDWFKYSGNAYKSNNKAYDDVTMKRRGLLGIIVQTCNVNIQLACDKNGNLS